MKYLYEKLQNRIMLLNEDVFMKANSNHDSYKLDLGIKARSFVDVYQQQKNIRMQIFKSNSYKNLKIIVPYVSREDWPLGSRIYIQKEEEIEEVMNLIEQSLLMVKVILEAKTGLKN
jgi:predicted transport protein